MSTQTSSTDSAFIHFRIADMEARTGSALKEFKQKGCGFTQKGDADPGFGPDNESHHGAARLERRRE